MDKIAIVVGHTQDSKGACSPLGIPCEWDFNKKVAEYLTDIADIYYYDTYSKGYNSMVRRNAAKVNLEDYKIVIELHYNSYSNSSANGTEALYWATSTLGKQYAMKLVNTISKDFGTTIRRNGIGIVSSTETERGREALRAYKAPTVLIEPFFGTNISDVKLFKDKEEIYSLSIRKFLKENFKIC